MNHYEVLADEIEKLTEFSPGDPHLPDLPYPFDHGFRFFYRFSPQELEELPLWDKNYFFLLDLQKETGLEYKLDENGLVARLGVKSPKGKLLAQSILDMRDPDLLLIYCFGDKKTHHKLMRSLEDFVDIRACHLNPITLKSLAKKWGPIEAFSVDFEQPDQLFERPVRHKALYRGPDAEEMFFFFAKNQSASFGLEKIELKDEKGDNLAISISKDGIVEIETNRHLSVYPIINELRQMIRARLEDFSSHLSVFEPESQNRLFDFRILPVKLEFCCQVDKMDGLLNGLVRGKPPLKSVGSYFRASKKLWRVALTKLQVAEQIEFEAGRSQFWFFPQTMRELGLIEELEAFAIKHVHAGTRLEIGP